MNKQLLKQRFCSAKDTYIKHATVQASMARDLVKLAEPFVNTKHCNMLELGSGTGLLTNEVLRKYKPKQYKSNDLVPCTQNLIQSIVNKHSEAEFEFLAGDIEQINFPTGQDIVWSGATIQWIQDLSAFFAKMHQAIADKGYLVLSSFGPYNYHQIKSITGHGIQYPEMLDVLKLASEHFEVLDFKEYQQDLWFNSPVDVLKHMRYTGVNGTSKCKWTKTDLLHFTQQYQSYKQGDEYPLTYHPYLVVLQKR